MVYTACHMAGLFAPVPDHPWGEQLMTNEERDLIARFVARIGEQIHDYSVSGRLARLRRRFANA